MLAGRALGRVTLLACLVLGAHRADGQEAPPSADRWKTALTLLFSGSSGNEELLVLSTSAQLRHLASEHFEFEVTCETRYARSEGDVVANRLAGTTTLDFAPASRVSPFFFASAEREPLRRLDLRAHGGAGAKYTFWRRNEGEASVSLAALYSFEDYDGAPAVGLSTSDRDARWSLRLQGERKLNDAATVRHTTFYQPVWDRASDYLMDIRNSLLTTLTAHVSLHVSHQFLRDATPLPGVGENDHRVEAGLTFEF